MFQFTYLPASCDFYKPFAMTVEKKNTTVDPATYSVVASPSWITVNDDQTQPKLVINTIDPTD